MTDVSAANGDNGAEIQAAEGAAPAPAAAQTQAGAEAPWFDGIDDPDLKAWTQNKQFPTIRDALDSHRNLEKLLGSEKVPLPKDEADKEGYDRLYKALGRPDSAEGYKLPIPEGMDPAFARDAAVWFHESGLSERQAAGITAKWNAYADAKIKADQDAWNARSLAEMGELEAEWGPKAAANRELAQRTVRQFGIDTDKSGAIERAIGTRAYMDLLVKVGTGLGEHPFEVGDTREFASTQAGAQARITALAGDKEWSRSYLAGDKTKLAEMERLQKIAYPGEVE